MQKIAVRELAYFVYQTGNLTNNNSFNQSSIDGKYLHQLRQSEYDKDSIKEYYITKNISYLNEEYEIHGYIDGILEYKNKIRLEEIKTTSLNIYSEDFKEASEHLAQLKIYGYLYLLDLNIKEIELNLLYIERDTYKRRNFKYNFNFNELEDFFFVTLKEYLNYLKIFNEIEKNRIISAKYINFPFSNIRRGQQEMLDFLEQYMYHSTFSFILAPTGIGKTVTSLYTALKKAINKNDKIFFLTAKTSGKKIASETMELFIKNGYKGKTLIITAKRKICLLNKEVCDTNTCPYAKDFFAKLKGATTDILLNEDLIDYDKIINYSLKHELCSFEFSLNLSLYVGVIICDYNYLFDPKVKLIRFFEENNYNNLILVDESHNLVSRSQNMYSSSLGIIDLLVLKKYLKDEENIAKKTSKLINYIHKTYDSLIINDYYLKKENDIEIEDYLIVISEQIEELLDNKNDLDNRDIILDKYLLIKDYLRISKLYSSAHIFLIKIINDNLVIYLNCLDASCYLANIVKDSTLGITYFSATLYPIDYYHKMLVGQDRINYLELESPFDVNNLGLYISPVSTRYQDRKYTISYIRELVNTTINNRYGKYIVFFPSYVYLNMFLEDFSNDNYKIIVQKEGLNEQNQIEILEEFNKEQNVLGLFVLGGVFAEGIDFIGDKLHGVIVVGVGFPQINLENEILKVYFTSIELAGFDYAYTYPGFNKVIQAAGRVIRTEQDKGIVLLLDDRYLSKKYLNLYPKHWNKYKVVRDIYELDTNLTSFWNK